MDTIQHQLSEAQPAKLTKWKKEPDVRTLKLDLEAARPSHDTQIGRIQKWNDLMAVKGKAAPPSVKGRSSVQPKMIRRQAEWRYSALTEPFLGSNKLFKVSPVTFEDDKAAQQNELVLNWQFRTKLNRVKFVDDFVRATVDEGTSIIRTGWRRVTTTVKQQVPVWTYYQLQDEQQAQALQQAIAAKQEDPHTFEDQADPALKEAVSYFEETNTPTLAVQTGTQLVDVEKVLVNQPTAEILNPENVYIDPSCNGDIEKALFAVISFETNKADLLKEPKRYKNLDRVNWSANSPATEANHATKTPDNFQFADALRKRVVAYEYWGFADIEDNGTLVPFVATWIGDVVIRMELNPHPDQKIPLILVPYLPVKRDLYGEPDAELLEDNQKIVGAVTRGMIDLLGRSANSQQGFAKGMLDPLNRRRFENGLDYEFNPTVHPTNGLIEHKYPELPQSALLMLNLQNQDGESLTGVKSFSGGISGEAYGDVAAGIRGVMDASSKREMAILRRLAKGMTELGQKIIAMNQVFLSAQEVVRVTNTEFVKINRDDLQGNFDLETDISTAEVDNAKAQDLGFMLQTIGPNTDPSIVMEILAQIAELKRMPALAHKLRSWKPQISPEQQQMQQLELQEKQMQIQKLQSEIRLNEAKATEALSRKDKLSVEAEQQATGITHAQNMEAQQAQSRGNQALEITKALTKPTKEGEKSGDIEAALGFNQLSDRLESSGVGTPTLNPTSAAVNPTQLPI